MTREEEYALESLWHEIWHNRQTGNAGIKTLEPQHPTRRFAETLNQAVARLTYPRFLERLGGTASHQAWVLENGYSYSRTVRRLWAIVRRCGLDPVGVAGDFAAINAQGNLLSATDLMAKQLAKRSGIGKAMIHAALDALSVRDDAAFTALLDDIKSL
ncbi:hypothetical protein [Thiocystis minor]|uniref:hypothetical protein n=1 Tax=Thiocystis minor TaxID=61597 RepID=UPI0019135C1E|nr:hypothetical protein [Thiocystis minor]